MSDFYHRFRSEIAAGGAVDESDSLMATRNAKITGVAMIVLLGFLATKSPWTFLFVVGLLFSVFMLELGHYSTARSTGMKVTQFFMGFGPRVWSRTKGEVEFGVRALPLGAFVRIIGMNNVDEVDPADESRAYRSQTFPRRLLVITAGSLMHMLIAFVLFFGVYTSGGRQQNTGISTIRGLDTMSSPASKAGLVQGDTLVSLGGVRVTDYRSVANAIQTFSVGESIAVVYEHNGVRSSRNIILAAHPTKPGRAYLGVMADDWGWKHLGVIESVGQSVSDIGHTVTSSVKGVVVALNPLNSIRHLTKSSQATLETRPTTVVGISEFSGTVGRSDGLKGVLILLASINVFVGVFNMFPLLPFDGGHAAIAIYERVRSRKGRLYKADINKMVPLATLVVGLLSLLLLTGLYLDITQPLG